MHKAYGVNELRKMYLDFFESKDHLIMKSFSLVPHNDKSLLLINAGMAPLKPYFTGQEIPPRRRVSTCQKCIRTGDIENVGKTARHGTFFEMLGNFSFGDYFKLEALQWTWEFLTEWVGLEPDRLYPSVFLDDDEAFDIWNKVIGVPAERISRFGKEDNFWEHGAGPCGPCSEVYYDRGEKYGCGKPDCKVGCDCDRYIEIWNNVFTQFDGDGKGNYVELENKNIDTGMGLERLAVVSQDVDSIFDVDTICAIRDKVCEAAGVAYHTDEKKDISIRLITDHIRSATFMISDGINASNEGRGYVLRRLIRRAARHIRMLGIADHFMPILSETVIECSKDAYPELEEKKAMILKTLADEEDRFYKTLDQGMKKLNEMLEETKAAGKTEFSGADAFKLYDTFGFPLDLTSDVMEDAGLTVDVEGFEKEMENQRETARKARKTTNYMGADATVYEELPLTLTTEFTGYDVMKDVSNITALTSEDAVVETLAEGDIGTLIVAKTPFYATKGGQEADKGIIKSANAEFEVKDVIALANGVSGHVGVVTKGQFVVGDEVELIINEDLRKNTAKNHSATHLLQAALRQVLGNHVEQAGSHVTDNELRFDFTHFSAMTTEEILKVEKIVNEKIAAFLDVNTDVMDLDEAKKSGAMALFGEKYGDKVRVVKMGDFSKELCGGTHVGNTGTIGMFKIVSEGSVASGVRRITAITSQGVLDFYRKMEKAFNEAAAKAKVEPEQLAKKIEDLQAQIKDLQGEINKMKSASAKDALGEITTEVVNGINLVVQKLQGVDMNQLRELGDQIKEKISEGVVVLASELDGKVNLIVTATDGAQKQGAHAGNIIKAIAPIVGGGGGGRPNMAQAGGKNPAGIDEALEKVKTLL
ncbi:MAG: alanine--tRNA ligase [Lachnospiraceae bacterium]|nr:alanine--tRNA ligase [Lachnospiraceae bacterium]